MAVTELQPAVGDVAGRPMEWLEAEICTLAGHIAAATCRFLLLVGEFDRRGGWRTLGVHELRALVELEVRHQHPHRAGARPCRPWRSRSCPS